MKTAEQIKGAVKNIAKKMNLKPQEVLQIFMFERLVERLSISKNKENFILKGGLLIASMIGIAERTTMDMDTTIQGLPMTEQEMERIVKEILRIDVGQPHLKLLHTMKATPAGLVGTFRNQSSDA